MAEILDWSSKFLFGRARPASDIKIICIHVTVNKPGTPAENVANYQINTQSGSYHELVDANARVLIENTDNWFTWSSGNWGNNIGWHQSFVMMGTETREQWLKYDAMLRAGAQRAAIRCKKYGIPPVKLSAADLKAGKKGFCGHLETGQAWGGTDHVDPGKGFPWDVYLRYVREYMGDGGKHAAPAAPAPKRVWPMAKNSFTISSGFGPRWGTNHNGIDLAAPLGTPIYSTSDGLVIEGKDRAPGSVNGFGNWVWIDSQREVGRDFIYGHMRHADIYVRKGDRVKAGQLIARVGSEGGSTGPHLHFEEWTGPGRLGGRAVDPHPGLKPLPYPGDKPQPAKEQTVSSTRVLLGGESAGALHEAKVSAREANEKADKIMSMLTLVADQLLGWPKNDKGDYLIAGWDVDSIITAAEQKMTAGKGVTLVEQVALLQKTEKHQNEALTQTNRAISEMLMLMKGAK